LSLTLRPVTNITGFFIYTPAGFSNSGNVNIEIIRFSINQAELVSRSREIRTKVFVEEQHVPEEIEYDEYEAECHHYLMIIGDAAIATCRWRHTPKGVKLERFAVLEAWRGKGYGNLLVEHVLSEVTAPGKPVYLHAQEAVIPFYYNLGFRAYGDVFIEADIRHFLMKYEPGT